MRIKKGDTVEVLSGNDKGKTGEVLEVIPKVDKVIVKGVNIRKKHVKPRKQGEEGGIIPVEVAIPSSKVNVVCSKCGKATRVGYSEEKGKKIVARGETQGYIAKEKRGENGFGFDEIFLLENGKTLAELDSEEKNQISSRKKALESLKAQL